MRPRRLVRDAGDHGVEVRAVDVNASDWDATLEPAERGGGFALRIGFRQIKGMPEAGGASSGRAARQRAIPIRSRYGGAAGSSRGLERLAKADAFRSMGLTRREALWALKGLGPAPLPLFAAAGEEEMGAELRFRFRSRP